MGSGQVGVFICLNIIQFVVGSYIEPRVSGAVLAMSPTVVLLAVFLWTFLWGLFGAFIGVPIVIAIITFCSYHPSRQMGRGPPWADHWKKRPWWRAKAFRRWVGSALVSF